MLDVFVVSFFPNMAAFLVYLLESGGGEVEATAVQEGVVQEVWVKCPLGVVSQRDGVHACDPTGKPSLSIFKTLGTIYYANYTVLHALIISVASLSKTVLIFYCLPVYAFFAGYDFETDTSLVECRPYTGRTHQLRLHLQLLGFPIANDPCYGGVLFYGDEARRIRAVEAVKEMRKQGIIPLSKVPHFGDPEVDNLLLSSSNVTVCSGGGVADERSVPSENAQKQAESEVTAPFEGESEDDYLVRTCR